MLTFRLFILIVLTVARALAQAPMVTPNSFEDSSKAGATAATFTTPAAALPRAPSEHRVIDRKFVAAMGALGGAESMRFTSRKLVLDHEFAAGAPWVTHVTPGTSLAVRYGAVYAAELVVVYELKKRHSWLPGDKVIRKSWWAYPATMATIHIKNGVGNIRTQGPGGCTSVQCAEEMQTQ